MNAPLPPQPLLDPGLIPVISANAKGDLRVISNLLGLLHC